MARKYYSGWPDGEAGNTTGNSPVEAGTGDELGNTFKSKFLHSLSTGVLNFIMPVPHCK